MASTVVVERYEALKMRWFLSRTEMPQGTFWTCGDYILARTLHENKIEGLLLYCMYCIVVCFR